MKLRPKSSKELPNFEKDVMTLVRYIERKWDGSYKHLLQLYISLLKKNIQLYISLLKKDIQIFIDGKKG